MSLIQYNKTVSCAVQNKAIRWYHPTTDQQYGPKAFEEALIVISHPGQTSLKYKVAAFQSWYELRALPFIRHQAASRWCNERMGMKVKK